MALTETGLKWKANALIALASTITLGLRGSDGGGRSKTGSDAGSETGSDGVQDNKQTYMESESFDCPSPHELSLLSPSVAVLLSQLHQAGHPPDQPLGVEGRRHQLSHVEVIIKGQDCN